jgi:hypothetical protein
MDLNQLKTLIRIKNTKFASRKRIILIRLLLKKRQSTACKWPIGIWRGSCCIGSGRQACCVGLLDENVKRLLRGELVRH